LIRRKSCNVADHQPSAFASTPGEFAARLEQIARFFQGNDRLHQAMRRGVDELNEANIQ